MTLTVEEKREIKYCLKKLEGVAEGLGIFHPRIGHYIQAQVDSMSRIFYDKDDARFPDYTKTSYKSKPGFEGIDAEVAAHPENFELADDGDYPVRKNKKELRGKIVDRKVMDGLV